MYSLLRENFFHISALGREYYFNPYTKESQWEVPLHPAVPTAPATKGGGHYRPFSKFFSASIVLICLVYFYFLPRCRPCFSSPGQTSWFPKSKVMETGSELWSQSSRDYWVYVTLIVLCLIQDNITKTKEEAMAEILGKSPHAFTCFQHGFVMHCKTSFVFFGWHFSLLFYFMEMNRIQKTIRTRWRFCRTCQTGKRLRERQAWWRFRTFQARHDAKYVLLLYPSCCLN